MIIAVILWRLKKGSRDAFIKDWKQTFVVHDRAGLVGEFLSEPIQTDDPRLRTLDLGMIGESSEDKLVLINVGIWRSEQDFQEQVGRFIKSTDSEKRDYELEVRQRILLNPIAW